MFGETRDFTDQEIAAILSRTRIPTLVIEGRHDLFLFRRIQEDVGPSNISLFAVGGKSRVISAFQNCRDADGIPILFFADKDEWIFCAIPQEFDDDKFETTDGYSVENDLIRDGNILEWMYPEERIAFEDEVSKFSHWFSLQMMRHLKGDSADLKKFPGRILDSEEEFQNDCALAEGEANPDEISRITSEDPIRTLRGKSLLQIIARQLNAVGRQARHQPKAMLEAGAASRGENYTRILNWVSRSLQNTSPVS